MFFSNADMYYLDESIANLDRKNRLLILYECKEYLKDKTSLFISH